MSRSGHARVLLALQGVAIAGVLLAASLVAALADRTPAAPPGHLALLLSNGHAAVVADHVAPSVRGALGERTLRAVWAAAVQAAGPLRAVSAGHVVHESGGAQDELEVLQFAHGSGTLAARRSPRGIVGLILLLGTASDPAAATTASVYAEDLVAGRIQPLRASFDQVMASALPADVLGAETSAALTGLEPPATVGGQVVVRRGALTVVETYLLFRNGLRRIEVTFDASRSIAGLYIRPL